MVAVPAPGEILNGAAMSAIGADIGAWVDWSSSFTITAATTNPTKGNSTYTAGYLLVGKTCHYDFKFSTGSTFVAGSGAYTFPLPFTPSPAAIGRGKAGPIFMNVGGVRVGFGFAIFSPSGTGLNIYWWNNTTGLQGPIDHTGNGHAWASGDYLICNLTYETV